MSSFGPLGHGEHGAFTQEPTGEVYRAAKAAAVARKQRELQKKMIRAQAQPPAALHRDLMCVTQLQTSRVAGTEGTMSRRRTSVSA
jgi:hypothetical protein